MLYSINEITNRVRTAMARGQSTPRLVHCHDPDVVEIDAIIRDKIQQCATWVYSRAPLHLVAEAARDMREEGVYWHSPRGSRYSGHVLLPDDFLRLLVFEMSDWSRPVYEALDAGSPAHDMALYPHAGVCGSVSRPVCFVSNDSEGCRLSFFCSNSSDAQVVQAKYIPRPLIEHGAIDLASRSLDQVVYATAAATLTTIGDFENAKQMINLIQTS